MSDLEDTDQTVELAAVVGLPVARFAHVLGAGWQVAPGPVSHDFDLDPSGGLEAEVTPWHVGGDPIQLMVRVFSHGLFIARPDCTWSGGPDELRYWPTRPTYVPRDAIDTEATEALVRDLLRRRRAAFRYCRYCRRATPPELLVGDSCMGCATHWEGVVF